MKCFLGSQEAGSVLVPCSRPEPLSPDPRLALLQRAHAAVEHGEVLRAVEAEAVAAAILKMKQRTVKI